MLPGSILAQSLYHEYPNIFEMIVTHSDLREINNIKSPMGKLVYVYDLTHSLIGRDLKSAKLYFSSIVQPPSRPEYLS